MSDDGQGGRTVAVVGVTASGTITLEEGSINDASTNDLLVAVGPVGPGDELPLIGAASVGLAGGLVGTVAATEDALGEVGILGNVDGTGVDVTG